MTWNHMMVWRDGERPPWWRIALAILKWAALAVAAFFGWRAAQEIVRAVSGRRGRVHGGGDYWRPVSGRDNQVLVTPDAGDPEIVTLPAGVTYKDVRAVKLTDGSATVEVKHEATDRSGFSGAGAGNRG